MYYDSFNVLESSVLNFGYHNFMYLNMYFSQFSKEPWLSSSISYTAQKMKFSIKDIFSKCDIMENFIFCVAMRNATMI